MSTIECNYDQFKMMSKEFFEAIPTSNLEQLDAGLKCLNLAYLGLKFGDSELDKINEQVSAPIILKLAFKHYTARELELTTRTNNV